MKIVRLAALALLATLVSAQAFVFHMDGSNRARRWNLLTPTVNTNVVNPTTHAIRYFIPSVTYSTTNIPGEQNAIRASFGQWQAVPNTHLKFEDAGFVSPPYDLNLNDNTNVVFWATNTSLAGGMVNIGGAVGFTYYSTDGNNNILQADIVLNAAINASGYQWFTDFNNSGNTANSFVEGVMLHEIGHMVGVQHSPVGGASMLYAGIQGINLQAGLCSDEIHAARFLYPVAATNYGAIRGTVTRSGVPILGAAVFAQDSVTNVVAGTVTRSDGTFLLGSLVPGNYLIRVAPLDPSGAAYFICRGADIDSAYNAAITSFLPTTNILASVSNNATNVVNFAVTNGDPLYRVQRLRKPASGAGFSYSSAPYSIRAGTSNFFFGVAATNFPSSGMSLTLTGDGLTIGSPTYQTGLDLDFSPNTVTGTLVSASISVASNATPGLRSIIIQQGSDIAYANGCLEILPTVTDYNFDGLDDIFQRQYFPVFTVAQAAPGADPDGDKFNNYSESVAATIPTNAASLLTLSNTTTTASGTTVRWQSVSGKRYQVSSRLTVSPATPWQNIGAPVTAGGSSAQYLDNTATNGFRFYRVEVLP